MPSNSLPRRKIGRGSRPAQTVVMAGLLLSAFLLASQGQTVKPAPSAKPPSPSQPQAAATPDTKQAKPPTSADRRRAAKLYAQANKLFAQEEFEQAMGGFERAAALDPSNANYHLAAGLARDHAVTVLVQAASKDRQLGDTAAARAALAHGLELDPKNVQVAQQLNELSDDALRGQTKPLYDAGANSIGNQDSLSPKAGVQSFHIRTDTRQAVQQIFRAYGFEATVDDSIRSAQVRMDLDDVTFEQAAKALGLVTNSFYVPLDAHRVLVAKDTHENRQLYTRQELETVYLPGLSSTELTEVGNLAKNVFEVQQSALDPTTGTLTLRAPGKSLEAFNATVRELLNGRSQVILDVRLIQIAHTNARNTGVLLPQQSTAMNVYAAEQSILNANQALVQQIIASGLAPANEPLVILGILAASGQVPAASTLMTNGLALFGGGLTQSAFSPSPLTLNISLNSSDTKELEQLQMHLGDGEAGTLRSGTRYPIQTSSFSGLSASLPNIPGLNAAGASGALASLAAQYATSVPNVPQVEYQDLGLTLKATPSVMRNGDVALNIDLKITSLAGSSINGNPILNNRDYSGVVMVKEGEAVVVASEVDKSESRAVSGTPGLSEIPGLDDLTDKDTQKNYASLLTIVTPHIIRGTQIAGHSAMMRVEKGTAVR